jgi:hypothetical protein
LSVVSSKSEDRKEIPHFFCENSVERMSTSRKFPIRVKTSNITQEELRESDKFPQNHSEDSSAISELNASVENETVLPSEQEGSKVFSCT